MLEIRGVRLLAAIAVVNGLVSAIGTSVVLTRDGGPDAPLGRLIFVAAIIVFSLTPLQAAALWFTLGPGVRALLSTRAMRRQIDEILSTRCIDTAFQPIIDVQHNRVVGAEALTRFVIEKPQTPDVWFAAADTVGRGIELESLALITALNKAHALPESLYVALNVSPAMLVDAQLLPLLAASSFPLNRLVLEVTEHTSVSDYGPIVAARQALRQHGIRVSVDDAGAGYASLRHIVTLAPDLIKIDRSLICGVDKDYVRRSMVGAVVMFALQSGASVIAEGVETHGELAVLREDGVDQAQGYLIARPSTDARDWAAWCAPAPQQVPRVPPAVYVYPPTG
jgi:EAL domain-containing protein (putative c-di-GMP-specific phosphodiesterase class I)